MSKKFKPIPITIITGFLGAGKTTLLNHILNNNRDLRIAVLVNDFGAVNIDSELVVGIEGESISLANGCICCTIRDDLLAAIADLINREDRPEYIVIETSGVSDPFAVAATVLMPELRPYVMVDSIVTVADAEQLRDLSGEQELLAIDQIDAADIVVLNKVDLVTEAQRDVARSFIRGVTPNARILEVTHGRVPLELLLGVGAYSADRLQTREKRDVHTHAADELHDHDQEHHHHEHTDHTLVFNTVLYQTDQPLSYPALRQAINALPTTIFRAKGFVYLNEAPDRKAVIHIVGRRAALTFSGSWCGKPPKTRLVFIGSHGGVDATHLQTLLDGARLNQTLTSDDKPSEALAWVRKMGPDNQPQEQSS